MELIPVLWFMNPWRWRSDGDDKKRMKNVDLKITEKKGLIGYAGAKSVS